METESGIREFAAYLASSPATKPTKVFDAMGAERDSPPRGGTWPAGEVFLYPEYLAFLTRARYGPGIKAYTENVARSLATEGKDLYTLHKMAHLPGLAMTVIQQVSKHLKTKEVVAEALENPHSFAIPLASVQEVSRGGGYASAFSGSDVVEMAMPHLPYLRITTDRSTYIVCQALKRMGAVWSIKFVTSKWQTDVAEMLEKQAETNRRRASL